MDNGLIGSIVLMILIYAVPELFRRMKKDNRKRKYEYPAIPSKSKPVPKGDVIITDFDIAASSAKRMIKKPDKQDIYITDALSRKQETLFNVDVAMQSEITVLAAAEESKGKMRKSAADIMNIKQGIIWSMILAKPKSLERKRVF